MLLVGVVLLVVFVVCKNLCNPLKLESKTLVIGLAAQLDSKAIRAWKLATPLIRVLGKRA